jgi:CCR4-NOT transcription complex subunit 1
MDVHLLLAEWIRINQHPLVTDDICQSVVKKVSIKNGGWLPLARLLTYTLILSSQALLLTQDTEGLCFFVRMCTEVCVDHYMSRRSSSPTHQRRSVAMIDSYAKLVSCMAAQSGKTRNLEVFGKALSVIVLVLAHHHERLGSDFNQKPFLRLLTSLYAEIHGCMDLTLLIAFR